MKSIMFPKYEIEASFAPWQTVIKLDGKLLEGVRSYKLYSDSEGITHLELEIFPGHVLVSGEGLRLRHDGKTFRLVQD
jgi:hypothetical protein